VAGLHRQDSQRQLWPEQRQISLFPHAQERIVISVKRRVFPQLPANIRIPVTGGDLWQNAARLAGGVHVWTGGIVCSCDFDRRFIILRNVIFRIDWLLARLEDLVLL